MSPLQPGQLYRLNLEDSVPQLEVVERNKFQQFIDLIWKPKEMRIGFIAKELSAYQPKVDEGVEKLQKLTEDLEKIKTVIEGHNAHAKERKPKCMASCPQVLLPMSWKTMESTETAKAEQKALEQIKVRAECNLVEERRLGTYFRLEFLNRQIVDRAAEIERQMIDWDSRVNKDLKAGKKISGRLQDELDNRKNQRVQLGKEGQLVAVLPKEKLLRDEDIAKYPPVIRDAIADCRRCAEATYKAENSPTKKEFFFYSKEGSNLEYERKSLKERANEAKSPEKENQFRQKLWTEYGPPMTTTDYAATYMKPPEPNLSYSLDGFDEEQKELIKQYQERQNIQLTFQTKNRGRFDEQCLIGDYMKQETLDAAIPAQIQWDEEQAAAAAAAEEEGW